MIQSRCRKILAHHLAATQRVASDSLEGFSLFKNLRAQSIYAASLQIRRCCALGGSQ